MSQNVYELRPPAASAAVEQAEPLEAAVREVSAYIAHHIGAARRGYSRTDELRTGAPEVRRKGERPKPLAMDAPVNFFSIEEADCEAPAPLQAARGGR